MPSPIPANKLPRKSPWHLYVSSATTLLKRVWISSYEDGVYNRAAELAYFFFLSLFPAVIFVTTLLGFVFKSNTQLTCSCFSTSARRCPVRHLSSSVRSSRKSLDLPVAANSPLVFSPRCGQPTRA